MALFSIRLTRELGSSDVLAPERYDPRRTLELRGAGTVALGDIVRIIRRVVHAANTLGDCLVLDTSDAREGIVVTRKSVVPGSTIGSAKKTVEPRDVIISRLRPYLRQVALIDEEIPGLSGRMIVCSTEFFVLRSPSEQSIAFLVPYLLATAVQQVLAAAQEGGHHPRVNETTLLQLPVPSKLLDKRDNVSAIVEKSVHLYRASERSIHGMIVDVEGMFDGETGPSKYLI